MTTGRTFAAAYYEYLTDEDATSHDIITDIVAEIAYKAIDSHGHYDDYDIITDGSLAAEFERWMGNVADNEYVEYGAGGAIRSGMASLATDAMDWQHLWDLMIVDFMESEGGIDA